MVLSWRQCIPVCGRAHQGLVAAEYLVCASPLALCARSRCGRKG